MSEDGKTGGLLEFPTQFPIKTMGRDTPEFRAKVLDIVRRHAGEVSDDSVRTAPSREGRFVSITVTIEATSQAQLDAIYGELTADEDVLFSL